MIQILMHMVFFLHLATARERRWSLVALMFTVVIIVLLVGCRYGSCTTSTPTCSVCEIGSTYGAHVASHEKDLHNNPGTREARCS